MRILALVALTAFPACCSGEPNKNGDKPFCDTRPATVHGFAAWQFLDIGGERRLVRLSAGDDERSFDEVDLVTHESSELAIDSWSSPSLACANICVAAWRDVTSGELTTSVRDAQSWSAPVHLGGNSLQHPIVAMADDLILVGWLDTSDAATRVELRRLDVAGQVIGQSSLSAPHANSLALSARSGGAVAAWLSQTVAMPGPAQSTFAAQLLFADGTP